MQRKATMADVARLAGVGTMTVSRLLSGSATVADGTAKRIRWAVDTLQYRPNEVARALRGVRTRTIGVIVPYLFDPFFALCAHEIDSVAKDHGYSLIVTSSNEDPLIEENEARQMLRRHVDGLIIIPGRSSPAYLQLPEFSNIPVVGIDRPLQGSRFPAVLVQNRLGASIGVEHLIQHGHRRILYVAMNRDTYTMKMRYAGYRQAMLRADLVPETQMEIEPAEAFTSAIIGALKQRDGPTAIFAGNNVSMRAAMHTLRELGARPPDDVAVAGFDDFEMADLLHGGITVVRQPERELGRIGASLLFEQIRRGAAAIMPGKDTVLPVELIVRSSCGCHVRGPQD